jgi:hypothetical protein
MSKPLSLEQKAFNAAVKHARKQKACAKNSDGYCCYRTNDGKRCFIGCILPNRLYSPKMEENRFSALLNKFSGSFLFGWKYVTLDKAFGDALQSVHDNMDVDYWETGLQQLANSYGLKYTPPAS